MPSITMKPVVSHYNHLQLNELGIFMEDRFERRLVAFVLDKIMVQSDIKQARIQNIIDNTSRKGDLLATVSLRLQRMKYIWIDVIVSFKKDDDDQQSFDFELYKISL